MKNISSRLGHVNLRFFLCTIIFLTAISFGSTLLARQDGVSKPLPKPLNLSSTTIGDPKFEKTEIIQKTQRLQMPFIANEGQTDEKVAFYANTFGGTVFVTKSGEIVYSLPHTVAHASPLVHYDIDKNETGYTGLTGYRGKEGQCIIHRTLCAMYPYCTWNFPGYYSETNSLICHTDSPLCHSERSEESHVNNSPSTRRDTEHRVPTTAVVLKEEFIGAKISGIRGEGESVTKVSYFKGNDPSRWGANIATYDVVNLGEIYKGIELKLKAHGDNVEKLLYVKPGAVPEQIKISLSGIQYPENPPPLSPAVRGTGGCPPLSGAGGGLGASLPVRVRTQTGGLSVNEHGELVAETVLGPVKFTKPVAYQEINGKRVDVECKYTIADCGMQNAECKTNQKSETQNPKQKTDKSNPQSTICNPKSEYGFTVASYDRTKDLIIDPLLASTYLGGGSEDIGHSLTLDTSGNVYVTGYTLSTGFPTTIGAYDTSHNGGGDVFVSKLDGGLTSLLASTFLGGFVDVYGATADDYGQSLALDTNGNVYVTGYTTSTDFPTTSGAYDTSFNGGGDVFVSKLDGGLTSLLASTFLGGSVGVYSFVADWGHSLALDTSGNVYVTGHTTSADFPTTSGAYDTSLNGEDDAFVSKLDSGLTTLLASTYLGGSAGNYGYSLALDTSGNVYVAGYDVTTDFPATSRATGFPTTSGAYDTSHNGGSDVFVSKLDGGLTSLLASTFLGGFGMDYGYSLALDTSGNVYVTGLTSSTNFPTTSGSYGTSYNGDEDVFVSKLDGGLTSLLASTFLGGSDNDDGRSIALDTSGNVYVTGYTYSTDFPTPGWAYDTSFNGYYDVFVSKLDGGLTSLLASTFLGGSADVYGFAAADSGQSLALDTSGNVYVTGNTTSTDFPTTSGAYDTSFNGGSWDVFISRLDPALSTGTIVTTGSATNVTSNSATLNGTVNANGLSTTAWFEYGTISNSYSSISSKQTVNGTSDTTVSIGISGLLAGTTYYYRIAAQNSAGRTYGSENTFTTTTSPTPTPSPAITPTPTAPPTPTVCKATDIKASPKTLTLKTKESDDVTVTVTGSEGCPVVGETVTTTILKSGTKHISVSPQSSDTDTNGQAIFTITATNKIGNAKVRFEAAGVETTVKVRVVK